MGRLVPGAFEINTFLAAAIGEGMGAGGTASFGLSAEKRGSDRRPITKSTVRNPRFAMRSRAIVSIDSPSKRFELGGISGAIRFKSISFRPPEQKGENG